ncbi:hybrid sensor histidine kinase/response regulator [Azospirillum halopraeferens]|uniref:hybrid sensor histidine kinase/response regulator n=1 Tax=Azospirillum halopraeferens TaxID=34010 RepID=UPI00041E5BCD|nr:PAS domain S-box protein [Azospirillum halopraeferens]
MSLMQRLILLVIVALIPATVIEIDNELTLHAVREEEIHRDAARLVGLVEAEHLRLVEGVRQVLVTLAGTDAVRSGDDARCQGLLDRLRPEYPDHQHIHVVGRDGRVRCATDRGAMGIDVADRPHVRVALESGRFRAGGHIRQRANGRPALPFGLPYADADGEVAGVVTALVELHWLNRYLADKPLPPGTSVTIADRDGTVFARVPELPGAVGGAVPERLRGFLEAGAPGTAEIVGLDGVTRVVGYRPLGGDDGTFMAVGLDKEEAVRPLRNAMLRSLATIALVAAITLLVVWWGGRHFLRRPVAALIAATERWRAGDLSARSGLDRTRSDIGHLARAFDAMAADLQEQARLREEASRERAAALAQLNALLEHAPVGFAFFDRDRRYLRINDTLAALNGLSAEAHVGRRLDEVLPDAAAVMGPIVDRIFAAGTSVRNLEVMTGTVAEPDARRHWLTSLYPVIDDDAIVAVGAVVVEITELRDAEAARRRSEERFRAVFEQAAVGIERIGLDGRLLDVNDRLCAMLGRSRAELLGTGFRDLTDPADRAAEDALLDRLLAGELSSYAIEKRYRHADGRLLWVRVSSSLARITGTEEAYRIAVVEDITERRTMEEAVTRAREEAEQADRAKTRFLAAASHDLRQPLQSLFFFVAALAPHVGAGKGRDVLRHVERGLDSLKELLDSLLDVSRLDAGLVQPTVEDFAIGEILDHIGAAYAPIARGKGIDWRVDSCRTTVRSDRTLLQRMLRNLVENAIRYTPAGEVAVTCEHEPAGVIITVQDSGIGIPPDQLERIFEEFHQVANPERDRAQGLGLGLAIVRRLSQLLDHPVTVRSAPGGGSAFAITVPPGEARDAGADPSAAAVPAAGRGRFAVLVDDDAIVLMGLRAILTEWGYDVLIAGTPEQALERLRADGRRPDIIVSDYRLREGRVGTEVILGVRELAGADIPGVILTGETGPECLEDAARHGLRVVYKPVTPRQLGSALEEQMGAAE